MTMTKTPVLIMLRFDFFVQGGEMELERRNDRFADQSEVPEVMDNFIVLEGLDGSGTTTQLGLAEQRLKSRGIPHFCTSEPTQGVIGRIIRQILKKQLPAEANTVALLFAADRTEHLYQKDKGILAQLRQGRLVLSDRYLFSSLAYQSLGCDPQFVFSLNCHFPLPRHVIFLDTTVDVSQRRLVRRSADNQELYDDREMQRDILAAYESGFARFARTKMQLHRLNGDEEPSRVFEKFWSILTSLPIVKG
jgi:dTMP kinase